MEERNNMTFADVGKNELDKIEDLAKRTLMVDDETNPKLKGEMSITERTMALKFRHESPKLVLMLIDKLRASNKIIAALLEKESVDL